MTQDSEQFGTPSTPENHHVPPAEPVAGSRPSEDATGGSMTDGENSLLHKLAEVGDDTVKRLKEIFSEVDREELRKSLNRENVQRTIASTLDTFNRKAQALLAPKNEDADSSAPKSDPLHSETTLETNTDALGPVGAEAVNHDETPRHSTVDPPENETRSFT